jgi:hypothetical protein
MIPIQLSLSGFLSYRQRVEIDFSSFSLACIAGPNGAGKSSLLDAITWALFGQARKRDDSVIHAQCEAAEVALIFFMKAISTGSSAAKCATSRPCWISRSGKYGCSGRRCSGVEDPQRARTAGYRSRHRAHAAHGLRDLCECLLLPSGQSRPVHPAATGRPQAHPQQHPGVGDLGDLPDEGSRPPEKGGGGNSPPGWTPGRDQR